MATIAEYDDYEDSYFGFWEVLNSSVSHLSSVSLKTPKNVPYYDIISICISIFNFEVFKMGSKWGMTVILI